MITALPFIVAVHPPDVFVASTVYVPAVVLVPKFIEDPVPAIGLPTAEPLKRSW